MIRRQNDGVYTTGQPWSMAFTMRGATVCGVAHKAPLAKAAVIGVSTKPGLMVTTRTPDL